MIISPSQCQVCDKSKMVNSADSNNSIISGNGTVAVEPFNSYQVKVQAVRSDGNWKTTGGDIFFIRIFNEWVENSDLTCTEVAGATQVVSASVNTEMTDVGDGT
jgi:hypothetical protein